MSKSSLQFTGEVGIHYPLHVLNRYSLPELIDLAERALKTLGPFNFTRVWTNDNLEYRSVLASSAAILARLPVKLGTAVAVPYFRNPVDVAMAFATMSELAGGRDISLGLGPGSRSILTRHVVRTKPMTIMAELAVALRTLFAGDTLNTSDIPVLAEYFHLNAEHYALRFKTPAPIHLYYGPSLLKPAVLDLIARHFDGVVLQTLYGIDDMETSLAHLDSARLQSGVGRNRCAKRCSSTLPYRATAMPQNNTRNGLCRISLRAGRTTCSPQRVSIRKRFKRSVKPTPRTAAWTTPPR